MRYLFTYGTLQPARWPLDLAPVLGATRVVGAARVPGILYDCGTYPGAVLRPAGHRGPTVAGTVLELPSRLRATVLRALDRYEGPEFRRTRCLATLRGRRLECWVYVLRRPPDATALIIPNGRWAGPGHRTPVLAGRGRRPRTS